MNEFIKQIKVSGRICYPSFLDSLRNVRLDASGFNELFDETNIGLNIFDIKTKSRKKIDFQKKEYFF